MTISVQPSCEIGLFNWMANHPSISPHVRDDRIKGVIDLTPLNTGGNVFLRLRVGTRDAGFAILVRHGDVFEMHSGLLPEFRGSTAVAMGRAVIQWARDQLQCHQLTTWAWEHSPHVRLVTRLLGFKEVSRVDWPYTVGGQHARRVDFSIAFNHSSPCP
jgi:hypothetical protein